MKQILLMMPSYYNFDEVIMDGLIKYSGCKVINIDTSPKIAYRNLFDRILNFLSKIFLNKNLKPEMQKKRILEQINKAGKIDYLIVNRVDLINEVVFDFVIKKSTTKILLLWDSLSKISAPEKKIQFFDIVYSFDMDDCKQHNFRKIENFHFCNNSRDKIAPKYDVIYLGTLDSREADMIKIINYFKTVGKTIKAFLHFPSGKKIKTSAEIIKLEKIVPFKQSVSFAQRATVILDLAHHNQKGLSFRVFEAMALRKKLITTNTQIKHYDFYNTNNIFIIYDVEKIVIPRQFWDTPYENLPQEIVDKYSISNWVKKILSNE